MPLPIAALAVGGGLAGLGALGSWLGGREDAERLSDAYDRISGMANDAVNANQADIDAYRAQLADTYGANASKYADALDRFLNSDVYQNEGFNYQGNINDYFDPAANQRWQAEMDAINNAAASSGGRFSSDYLSRLGARAQAHTSEEWEKAYQKLQQDRQMALNEYNVNSQNGWNNYNAQQNQMKAAVDAYGNDRNNLMQGLSDVTQATMNNRLGGLNTQAQTVMGQANAQQGTSGWDLLGNLGAAGANFMGNFFNGRK